VEKGVEPTVEEEGAIQAQQQDSQHQALVVKLVFPLQMVKMAPTNPATGAVVAVVEADTMVAMAAKAQVVTLAVKQDLLAAVIPTLALLPIHQTDNQLI
jgi:hypothetical protein